MCYIYILIKVYKVYDCVSVLFSQNKRAFVYFGTSMFKNALAIVSNFT